MQLHLTQFPANDVWPLGGWSVYVITAEQIERSTERDAAGNVTARHAWPGFVGCYETLHEAVAAFLAYEGDQTALRARGE